MRGHAARVRSDIRRWREAGLLDGPTAEALLIELEARAGQGVSFASVLAMLAALLFAAALLVPVVAGWAAIPYAARLGGLAALTAVFTVAGFLLKARNRPGFAEAAWLAGAAAFGSAILLIGPEYGLQAGDHVSLLLWCLGTAAAGALFPSAPLTVAAAGLAAAWLALPFTGIWRSGPFPYGFPLLALGLWAVSLRSGSRRARELVLLSFLLYLLMLSTEWEMLAVGVAASTAFCFLFVLAVRRPEPVEALLKIAGRAPVYFLLGTFTGLGTVQAAVFDEAGFGLAAAAVIAAVAAALLLGGRNSPGVRRLCYVAFAVELCLVFAVTLGSTLDTVSFFLAAAALLAVSATAMFRLERRWRTASVSTTEPT